MTTDEDKAKMIYSKFQAAKACGFSASEALTICIKNWE